ncbi:MAG: MFS transporter [Pseudomonadota bacterium]
MQITAEMAGVADAIPDLPRETRSEILKRSGMIALIAFLTLVDLFGAQALLPTLVEAYNVSPREMGVAINASTIGMAATSLLVAAFGHRIDRRRGIWLCLTLLSLPTAALAIAGDLGTFTALRILQGAFMAAAFALTLTYLSEICTISALGGAMAAYITGNAASNLFGRLIASGLADNLGLAHSFLGFAVLNLLGAVAAYLYFRSEADKGQTDEVSNPARTWRTHLANRRLRALIVAGFLLLFVFVATFTYANFVLASDMFALPQAAIGLAYLVFAPSILTTPLAARVVARMGLAAAFAGGLVATMIGLALLLSDWLPAFLAGLALVGAGLFFAQSVATAAVGRSVTSNHAIANGLYLASYYLGGIVGAFVAGLVFEAVGWSATILLLAVASLVALAAAMWAVHGTDRRA